MLAKGGRPERYQRCATARVLAAKPMAVGGKLDVARGSGHAKSHVQRARAGVEDQGNIEQIALAEQTATRLGCSQQSDH